MDKETAIRRAIAEKMADEGFAWNALYDYAVGEVLRGVAEETQESHRKWCAACEEAQAERDRLTEVQQDLTRALSELDDLRMTLEQQAGDEARMRRVIRACQENRAGLPPLVLAALEAWEGGR